MKLKQILNEKLSGEIMRVKKLFITSFKTFLGGKSREKRLEFIFEVINSILTKAEIKFLILDLQKGQQKKKKK